MRSGVSSGDLRCLSRLTNPVSSNEVSEATAELSSAMIHSGETSASQTDNIVSGGAWLGSECLIDGLRGGYGGGGDEGCKQCLVGGGEDVPMTLKCRLTNDVYVNWNTMLVDGGKKLLVAVPEKFLPENGSRDSLISLLDHAEVNLSCTHVIVYFRKDRPDRQNVVRLFMYLGFCVVEPGPHPLLPSTTLPENLIHMAYEIQLDSNSDDDEDD